MVNTLLVKIKYSYNFAWSFLGSYIHNNVTYINLIINNISKQFIRWFFAFNIGHKLFFEILIYIMIFFYYLKSYLIINVHVKY
jgi:hypothetical protein